MRLPKVLLGEDDQALAILLRLALGRSGFEIETVSALGLLRRLQLPPRPDLVIAGVDFAELAAGAALSAIVEACGRVPVIAVTSQKILSENAALAAGARAQLTKPVRISRLLVLAATLTRSGESASVPPRREEPSSM